MPCVPINTALYPLWEEVPLASSQQVELPLLLAIPQDFCTTQRIVLPILVTVSCPLCSSHPVENPTQSKLLMFSHHGHIIVTMQVIHYHPDFHTPLFCTPIFYTCQPSETLTKKLSVTLPYFSPQHLSGHFLAYLF